MQAVWYQNCSQLTKNTSENSIVGHVTTLAAMVGTDNFRTDTKENCRRAP